MEKIAKIKEEEENSDKEKNKMSDHILSAALYENDFTFPLFWEWFNYGSEVNVHPIFPDRTVANPRTQNHYWTVTRRYPSSPLPFTKFNDYNEEYYFCINMDLEPDPIIIKPRIWENIYKKTPDAFQTLHWDLFKAHKTQFKIIFYSSLYGRIVKAPITLLLLLLINKPLAKLNKRDIDIKKYEELLLTLIECKNLSSKIVKNVMAFNLFPVLEINKNKLMELFIEIEKKNSFILQFVEESWKIEYSSPYEEIKPIKASVQTLDPQLFENMYGIRHEDWGTRIQVDAFIRSRFEISSLAMKPGSKFKWSPIYLSEKIRLFYEAHKNSSINNRKNVKKVGDPFFVDFTHFNLRTADEIHSAKFRPFTDEYSFFEPIWESNFIDMIEPPIDDSKKMELIRPSNYSPFSDDLELGYIANFFKTLSTLEKGGRILFLRNYLTRISSSYSGIHFFEYFPSQIELSERGLDHDPGYLILLDPTADDAILDLHSLLSLYMNVPETIYLIAFKPNKQFTGWIFRSWGDALSQLLSKNQLEDLRKIMGNIFHYRDFSELNISLNASNFMWAPSEIGYFNSPEYYKALIINLHFDQDASQWEPVISDEYFDYYKKILTGEDDPIPKDGLEEYAFLDNLKKENIDKYHATIAAMQVRGDFDDN